MITTMGGRGIIFDVEVLVIIKIETKTRVQMNTEQL